MLLTIGRQKIPIMQASSFPKRLFGLMGKENINYGMLFLKCNAIHTFFMKENIDIIGLDENKEVIYKYENLKPNQIVKIKHQRQKTSILELPQNTSSKIKIGTILIFQED